MLGLLPILPAYGRDYASASALIADFVAGKDFRAASGSYTNREDLLRLLKSGASITARYARNTRVCVFKLGAEPKPKAPRVRKAPLSMAEARAQLASAQEARNAARGALEVWWRGVRERAGKISTFQEERRRNLERKRLEKALGVADRALRRVELAMERAQ